MSAQRSIRLLTVGAVAAFGIAVPSAGAAGLDPSIYETGVPAGQIVHGVESFTITGAPDPESRRIEFWVSADRWREQTTDAKNGQLLGDRLHDASGTTWIQYKPFNGDPPVLHFAGNDSVPGPGFPAPFNTKLRTVGVVEGSAQHPQTVTLQPLGPQTIAGLTGTKYEQLENGQPGLGGGGLAPTPDSHAYLVLQDGTDQPLLREVTTPNGSYGTFDQRELLLSRETLPASRSDVLTQATMARAVTKWRRQVKVAKAAAKQQRHHQ